MGQEQLAHWKVAPWVHSFSLGNAVVLFDEKRQELHRLMGPAATAWVTLRKADGLASARLSASLIERWTACGLIVDRNQASTFERQADTRARGVVTRPYRGKPIDRAARIRRSYRVLGQDISVSNPSAAEAERIDAVLAHAASPANARPSIALDVVASRRGYRLITETRMLDRCDDIQALAPMVKSSLAQIAASRTPHLLGLHAAAFAINGSAILLPAPSGTGKTTLALAALHAGLQYLSDDMVLLDQREPVIMPVVNALCVKENGMPLARRFMPGVDGVMTHRRPDGMIVRYLRPPSPDNVMPAGRWPVRALFFPIRSVEKTAATRLPAIEALHRLLANCCSVARMLSRADVEMLVGLVEGGDNYEVSVADPVGAIELIAELCRAAPSGR